MLTTLLLDKLKKHEAPIAGVYYNVFSCISKEDLGLILQQIYVMKQELDNDEWFTYFHAMFRKNDVFQGASLEYNQNQLSDEEKVELLELRTFLNNQLTDYPREVRKTRLTIAYPEKMSRAEELKKREIIKKKESICGYLDMVVYHTIHADEANILHNLLNELFTQKNLVNG